MGSRGAGKKGLLGEIFSPGGPFLLHREKKCGIMNGQLQERRAGRAALRFGDVPKWLKGPHSKCGRRLNSAREFESLHLRQMNEGRSIEQFIWTVQYFYPHSILKTLVLSGFSHIFLCPPDGQPMTKSLKFILKNEEIAVLNPLSKSACGFFFALMERLKLVWGFVI